MEVKKYFITGIDTNIGKTYLAKFLCKNLNFSYYKPIQTGISESKDVDFISEDNKIKIYTNYEFKDPLCPYLAAQNENKEIKIEEILKQNESINENLLIEGAGGILVPIKKNYLMIDLILDLNLEVILISKDYLGTINHTLLTIDYLIKKGIKIKMIFMNDYNIYSKNFDIIKDFGQFNNIIGFYKEDSNENILKNLNIVNNLKEILL